MRLLSSTEIAAVSGSAGTDNLIKALPQAVRDLFVNASVLLVKLLIPGAGSVLGWF